MEGSGRLQGFVNIHQLGQSVRLHGGKRYWRGSPLHRCLQFNGVSQLPQGERPVLGV